MESIAALFSVNIFLAAFLLIGTLFMTVFKADPKTLQTSLLDCDKTFRLLLVPGLCFSNIAGSTELFSNFFFPNSNVLFACVAAAVCEPLLGFILSLQTTRTKETTSSTKYLSLLLMATSSVAVPVIVTSSFNQIRSNSVTLNFDPFPIDMKVAQSMTILIISVRRIVECILVRIAYKKNNNTESNNDNNEDDTLMLRKQIILTLCAIIFGTLISLVDNTTCLFLRGVATEVGSGVLPFGCAIEAVGVFSLFVSRSSQEKQEQKERKESPEEEALDNDNEILLHLVHYLLRVIVCIAIVFLFLPKDSSSFSSSIRATTIFCVVVTATSYSPVYAGELEVIEGGFSRLTLGRISVFTMSASLIVIPLLLQFLA